MLVFVAFVETKQKWRGLGVFDSFVALSRQSTSEERPLGEEGGVKYRRPGERDFFANN